MERPKYFIAFLLFFLAIKLSVFASFKTEIYEAYIGNNMEQWKVTIDKMNLQKSKNASFLLELLNYQYGYIAWCIGNKNEEEAKKYLELAQNNLGLLEKAKTDVSTISAYKSAFYGYEIGLNIIKAPFLGPKSLKYSKLAMEQNPQNPMGYIQYGNSQFYMPAIFGGSKKEAVEHFIKALELMEKETTRIEKDWNYLSLLTLIGQSFTEMKEYKNAKKYFEKALAIEPNFLFVKLELLPDLLENMK
jgi:tetratricopeptide (TPR) repeat protein